MPYVRCWSCGLTTYCARGQFGRAECPGCGTLLVAPGPRAATPPAVPAASSTPEEGVDRALALARRELDMDAALLTEIHDGREVVRSATGESAAFGLGRGSSSPPDDT